jgi:response regulator of citrate/malate metabolism
MRINQFLRRANKFEHLNQISQNNVSTSVHIKSMGKKTGLYFQEEEKAQPCNSAATTERKQLELLQGTEVLWRTQYHNVGRVANFLKVRVIHDFTFG